MVNTTKKHLIFFSALLFCFFAFLLAFRSYRATGFLRSVRAAASSDAIAVRVIPNPEHYSPLRWYEKQRFSGSPQSLTVDGYEAVRDGRTVYVNVANVSDGRLYTNIYLISYNQSAENATVDIFGQILRHWKFNTNIQGVGHCSLTAERSCHNTADCPAGEYCLSAKAKIVRDTRRLADLYELESAIKAYKRGNGYFPKLSSGTYLANKTVSAWPSWQASLGSALGMNMPVDPINKLGDCGGGGYDAATCWDENAKRFADPTPADGSLDLPEGSHAYVYQASPDGREYGLNMGLETGSIDATGNFIFNGEESEIGSSGSTGNTTSGFTGENVSDGYSGKEFTAFMAAASQTGDTLIWDIARIDYQHDSSVPTTTWIKDVADSVPENIAASAGFLRDTCLWENPQVLAETGVPGQRKIYAGKAGKAGIYVFTATIDDGGGPIENRYSFKIDNDPPVIYDTNNGEIVIGTGVWDDFAAAGAYDDQKYRTDSDYSSHDPLVFSVVSADPSAPRIRCANPGSFPCDQAASPVCGSTRTFGGGGPVDTIYQCLVSTSSVVTDTKEYPYDVTATDRYGEKTTRSFSITVKNNPLIPAQVGLSRTEAIAACPYNGAINAGGADPDGHNITYFSSADASSLGLSINQGNGAVSGTIPSGASAGANSFNVTVRDQYYNYTNPYSANAEAAKTLNLNISRPAINAIPDLTIYDWPTSVPAPQKDAASFYHNPPFYAGQGSFQYNYDVTSNVSPGAGYSIAYSFQGGNPAWLGIDPSGRMQGTPVNGDAGSSNVTVRALDSCGNSASKSYNITVNHNEWCGDRIKQADFGEACDCGIDNNGSTKCGGGTSGGDRYACASSCVQTGGWCGDGVKQGPGSPPDYGEQCDSGASNGAATGPVYDGANRTYSYCGSDCRTVSGSNYYCGDGSVNGGGENCDSGASNTDTPCTAAYNSTCSYCNTSCVSQIVTGPRLGDGIVNGAEQCDGGNLNGSSCFSRGHLGGTLSCNTDGTFDETGCYDYCIFDGANSKFDNCKFQ